MKNTKPAVCQRHQEGISLFVVMVMVLLGSLLVVWASRTALLNEMVTGNDSDYQRALEAAHALVSDAQLDIQNSRPDGRPCTVTPGAACREWGVLDAAGGKAFFPEVNKEFYELQAALSGRVPSCVAGVCTPDHVLPQFWNNPVELDKMKANASRYGEHTGAVAENLGNPLLPPAKDKGWYWVELLPFDDAAAVRADSAGAGSTDLQPDAEAAFVYRITAVAQGLKRGTQAVVQTVLVWKSKKS